MLAAGHVSLAATPGPDVRPLRGVGPARRADAQRRESVQIGRPPETEASRRPAAAGYGRAAIRVTPAAPGASAFLAQLIAQQDDGGGDAPRLRHEEGLAAYRRAAGDDLIVVGPAGAAGLIL